MATKEELQKKVDELETMVNEMKAGTTGVTIPTDLADALFASENDAVARSNIVANIREIAEQQYPEKWKR